LFTIQEKKLSVRDKVVIEQDGRTAATVKGAGGYSRSLFIEVEAATTCPRRATSSIMSTRSSVAAQAKSRSGGSGSAAVASVAPDQDDALMLAVAVCIDQMSRS
jgi:uncharacterized protein YxjI